MLYLNPYSTEKNLSEKCLQLKCPQDVIKRDHVLDVLKTSFWQIFPCAAWKVYR